MSNAEAGEWARGGLGLGAGCGFSGVWWAWRPQEVSNLGRSRGLPTPPHVQNPESGPLGVCVLYSRKGVVRQEGEPHRQEFPP